MLKSLRYVSGQWEISEETYKKIQGTIAFQHDLLPCGRVLFVTKNALYHFEGADLLQTIEMTNGYRIKEILKIHRGVLVVSE